MDKIIQKWHCDKCNKDGQIECCKGDGCYQRIEKVKTNHKHLSSDCGWDLIKIRIEDK